MRIMRATCLLFLLVGNDEPFKFMEAAKKGTLVPLYQCIFSDHLTPVQAYRCLVKEDDREAPSFLFESVEQGLRGTNVVRPAVLLSSFFSPRFSLFKVSRGQGRYSVVGAQPAMEIVAKENTVSIMDHEDGRMTEETVEDPMQIPRRIMEGWTPQLIDELPDAFCGNLLFPFYLMINSYFSSKTMHKHAL